jgi:hypothetical protein
MAAGGKMKANTRARIAIVLVVATGAYPYGC